MTDHSAQSYAQRALAFARAVATFYPRGSATSGEARAAAFVQQQLADLGVSGVKQQQFQGLRSIWLFLALAFGQALVGHAAFWLLKSPLGAPFASGAALFFFAFSSYLLWRKFTFRDFPLRSSLPHGPSQNIIAILPPLGPVHHRVILLGHLDAHRAVWLFATDWLTRLYAVLAPLAFWGVPLSALLYGLSQLPGLQVFAWFALPFALFHFIGWFTGMTADLGPYSPGANDNASAVGSLLAFAQRLKAQPLANTEVWLAFTGCEETGCDGFLALLEAHRQELRNALFVDLELVGIGDELAYLRTEGLARPRRIPMQVESLVQAVATRIPIHPLHAVGLGVFTENNAAWEHGFDSVCILACPSNRAQLPLWHRLSDRPERLSAHALELAHTFTWELLQQVDTARSSG
jgi:hypothetical protein